MKIFIANNFYDPNMLGGAERSVKILAESLVAAGDQVTVVSLAATPDQHLDTINGVRVHYVQSGNLGAGLADPSRTPLDRVLWHLSGEHIARSTGAIERLMRAENPDIVHSFSLPGMSFNVWRLANRLRVPLVHTLFDYYIICARGTMFRRGHNCAALCTDCRIMTKRRRMQTRRVDALVGASQYLVDRHLAEGCFAGARIKRVIYDGTPLPDPASLPVPGKSDVVRIGFLGRLHVTKGVEVLLDAVSHLNGQNWTLSVAGKGAADYEPQLRAKYSDPRIQFLGWSTADAFLRQIDVLVVPSIWNEPLGRITMEAYSYGVPVVASRRGGIPEVIEEGKTGFLFDPSCAGDLASVLDGLVKQPERLWAMREACLNKAWTEFGQEYSAGRYRALYRELLGNPT